MFLGKGVLKIRSNFTGEHPCRSGISVKLLCIFIEIALRHGCSPVNLPHILRTSLPKNTSGRLLLIIIVASPHFHNEIKLEVSPTVSELFSRFTTFYRNRAAIRLLMIPINQKTNIKTATYTQNFAGIFLFRIDGNLNGLPLINIWGFFLKFLEYSFSA